MALHAGQGAARVDLLTGQACQEVYLDPEKLLGKDGKPIAGDQELLEVLYTPVQVISEQREEGITVVRDDKDQVYRLQSDGLLPVKPEAHTGVPDILDLNDFSEQSLLHTLRVRYVREEVYTFVGPILISINPYKWNHAIYSEAAMIKYHTASDMESAKLCPHLFEVADSAYVAFINEGSKSPANQSIIISGESGAGKTEAMKIIMQYLARITHYKLTTNGNGRSQTPPSEPHLEVGELERKVLSTNPLLESFGNAKTVMNDNSSRFGKYIKIQFALSGRIIGAEITNYLLEKTRIVSQAQDERNFHIFYQLLRGGDPQLLADLELSSQTTEAFRYLTHGHCTDIEGRDDAADFRVTVECLESIGIKGDTQRLLFEVVAAVLHLGNVRFSEVRDGEAAVEQETSLHLEVAARMLRVDVNQMRRAFCCKTMTLPGKDELVVSPSNAVEAADKCDSLAKTLYACVFNWLVRCLNKTIAAPATDSKSLDMDCTRRVWGFMGVLDIYGFECFQTNGFEQLLINFANETLQNQFNRHIFEMEQEEYNREGIDWTYVDFNDNQPTLAMLDNRFYRESAAPKANGKLPPPPPAEKIERQSSFDRQNSSGSKPRRQSLSNGSNGSGAPAPANTCVFNILDDIRSVADHKKTNRDYDLRFCSTLHSTFAGKAQVFVKPRLHSDSMFGIQHYAGTVWYTTDGFTERNLENLHQNVRALALSSNEAVIADEILYDVKVMEERAVAGSGSGPLKKKKPSWATPTKASIAASLSSPTASSASSKLREASVSSQFRTSLAQLVDTLDSTSPRYIRCVRPNDRKAPSYFHSQEVLRQLRYAGMMEAIRIRQQGYALRESHQVMFKQFARIVPGCSNLTDLFKNLSAMLGVDEHEWQLGVSKVFLRKTMADKLQRLMAVRIHLGVRTIQRCWKSHKEHEAALKIQGRARVFVCRRRFHRICRSTRTMQKWYRMATVRTRYRRGRDAVIFLQSIVRRLRAQRRIAILRNPYKDMDEDQIIVLILENEAKLNCATDAKNYDEALKLQKQQTELEMALQESRARRPRFEYASRQELEAKIAEVETAIEEKSTKKDYSACKKLQEEAERLALLRSHFPTAKDIRVEISNLQKKIREAESEKDYNHCQSLAQLLRVIEYKHRALLQSEPSVPHDRFQTRAALEAEIASVSSKLNRLKEERKFGECEALQLELDELEAMRGELPTVADRESELEHLRAQLEDAEREKRYRECEQLQRQIKQLEMDIEELRATEMAAKEVEATQDPATDSDAKIHTRAELESAIARLQLVINEHLKEKRYTPCQLLQQQLDKLAAQRVLFPTAEDLDKQIAKLHAELNEHAQARRYAECAPIQDQLDKLQSKRAGLTPAPVSTSPQDEKVESATSPQGANTDPRPIRAVRPPSAAVSPVKSRVSASGSAHTQSAHAHAHTHTPGTSPLKARRQASYDSAITTASGRRQLQDPSASSGGVSRPVYKLRPGKAVTVPSTATVSSIARIMMSHRKCAAVILVSDDGALDGILTDTDVARRVVAMDKSPERTLGKEVMTPQPRTVRRDDDALDALTIMTKGGFRHLPVLDEKGEDVVGCLDIAKCLNDAITRLEKMETRIERKAHESSKAQKDAQALLSLMHTNKNLPQDFVAVALSRIMTGFKTDENDNSAGRMPTVKEMLSDPYINKAVIVQGNAAAREAVKGMADTKKACVIVDDRHRLEGIMTFKDVLCRIVAEGRSPATTPVRDVMTSEPKAITPDKTLLDALCEMRDGHFLNLPVVESEDTRTAMGLLSAMDIVKFVARMTGSEEDGGRAFWAAANEVDGDDMSDSASDAGSHASKPSISHTHTKRTSSLGLSSSANAHRHTDTHTGGRVSRPVHKLRPGKAVVVPSSTPVSVIAKTMVSQRKCAAVILVSDDRVIEGILTDTDVTRRVVALDKPAEITLGREVMTPRPQSVRRDQDSLDALTTMVKGGFRHLPVLDEKGEDVVGCLDIAKCLNDAITRLERMEARMEKKARTQADILSLVNSGQASHEMLMSALGRIVSGNSESTTLPTVRQMLADKEVPNAARMYPDSTVREAAKDMAASRKACVVVDPSRDNALVGIITFKDVLSRVVAEGRSPALTPVRDVMTTDPRAITPDKTLLDALCEMRDGHFLNLPVVESDDRPTAMGLLSAMDIVKFVARMGGSEEDGGRAFWVAATGADGDDLSDTASDTSSAKGHASGRPPKPGAINRHLQSQDSSASATIRPVSSLRPCKPLLLRGGHQSVLDACKAMKQANVDCALVVSVDGQSVLGIVTDSDVMKKVAAQLLEPQATRVSDIMTRSPKVVHSDSDSLEALSIMVENRFRHLPVVNVQGVIEGVLDIKQCMTDAIRRLHDRCQEARDAAGASSSDSLTAQIARLLEASSNPSLQSLIARDSNKCFVRANQNVSDAVEAMVRCRATAVLVLQTTDDHDDYGGDLPRLAGVFSAKDLMKRVMAGGVRNPITMHVSRFMTPVDEVVYLKPQQTALDALMHMRSGKFLHVPVVEEGMGERVLGMVDVMDLMRAVLCSGPQGTTNTSKLRKFFHTGNLSAAPQRGLMGGDEGAFDAVSATGSRAHSRLVPRLAVEGVGADEPHNDDVIDDDLEHLDSASVLMQQRAPSVAGSHLRVGGNAAASPHYGIRPPNSARTSEPSTIDGRHIRLKVVYESDIKSVTACIESYAALIESVCKAFPQLDANRRTYALIYHDEQGDAITVDSGPCLSEMINYVEEHKLRALKVKLVEKKSRSSLSSSKALLGLPPVVFYSGVGAMVAVSAAAAVAGIVLSRRKK